MEERRQDRPRHLQPALVVLLHLERLAGSQPADLDEPGGRPPGRMHLGPPHMLCGKMNSALIEGTQRSPSMSTSYLNELAHYPGIDASMRQETKRE